MEENKDSVPTNGRVELDTNLPFEEAIADVRSGKKNKHIATKVKGKLSDNYMVLKALFNNSPEPIDGYENKPWNHDGKPIENLKSRISDLKNKFGVEIWSRRAKGFNYSQYWIE